MALTISRHPDDLYINGIQRESFIPAIELIKDRFEVVDLDSGTGKPPPTLDPGNYLTFRLPKDPSSPLTYILPPIERWDIQRNVQAVQFPR